VCLVVVHGLCTLCHIMSCVGCRFCSSEVAGGFVVVVDHCVCLAGLHGFFFSVGMGGVFCGWHCAYHVLCTHGVW